MGHRYLLVPSPDAAVLINGRPAVILQSTRALYSSAVMADSQWDTSVVIAAVEAEVADACHPGVSSTVTKRHVQTPNSSAGGSVSARQYGEHTLDVVAEFLHVVA